MDLLRSHSNRHINGISDPKLYDQCFTKTKNLIIQFVKEYTISL